MITAKVELTQPLTQRRHLRPRAEAATTCCWTTRPEALDRSRLNWLPPD